MATMVASSRRHDSRTSHFRFLNDKLSARKDLNGDIMPPQTLERHVESLEQRVTVLEQLPARVDHLAVQISQLRDDDAR